MSNAKEQALSPTMLVELAVATADVPPLALGSAGGGNAVLERDATSPLRCVATLAQIVAPMIRKESVIGIAIAAQTRSSAEPWSVSLD